MPAAGVRPSCIAPPAVLLIAAWVTLCPVPASAQDEELFLDVPADQQAPPPKQPKNALVYVNTTNGRVNPAGFLNLFDVVFQRRLYRDDRDALAQNFAGLGFASSVSPAFARFGVVANVQPLSLLQLYARFLYVGYFGSTNLIASFDSADADFSDEAIEVRAKQPGTENYATTGGDLTLGLMLRGLRLGPIAIRDHFRAKYNYFQLREGDVVKYEQIYDLLMPNDGWAVSNELDVMWLSGFGLAVSLRYTFATGIFEDRHYRSGVKPPDPPSNAYHRLGPLVSYTFRKRPGSAFDSPTIILMMQWHLAHRYRAGQEVSQAVPQLLLAFQFRGTLFAEN